MKTKQGLGMWAFALVVLVVVIEEAAAQGVTAGIFRKPYVTPTKDLLLKSLDEAKEACVAYGMVIATEDQVKALITQNGGSYTRDPDACAWMANGKTASPGGTALADCTMAKTGADVWCIEAPDYTCPKDWTWLPGSMSCFKYTATATTFAEAKTNCSELGGYLATIESLEEQAALEKMAVAGPAFIGISGNPAQWNDGSMRPAPPPTGIEFSNPGATDECAGVDNAAAAAKKWTKLDCATKRPYICEMDLGMAPHYTVSFETSYVTTGAGISGNCRANIIPVVLSSELKKKYAAEKNLLCTAMTGVVVSGPSVGIFTVQVTFPNATKAVLVQRVIETFKITSKNYALTLGCARYLEEKLPVPIPKIDAGAGCPVLELSGKRHTTLDGGPSCDPLQGAYDMKRSCLPVDKACTAFSTKATDKGLHAEQRFIEYETSKPAATDRYVMTEEKCAAICKNYKSFTCQSYSYTLASGVKPVKAVCKISPQRASMYETGPAAITGTSYYERVCPLFKEAPVSRRMSITQTFNYKPADKPECATSNSGADLYVAAVSLQESFIANTNVALKAALASECGFITGMPSFKVTGFGKRIPTIDITGGSVQFNDFFSFEPTTPLVPSALISDCIAKFIAKQDLLKPTTKYDLGPLCKKAELEPTPTNPTLVLVPTDAATDCKYADKRPFPSSVYFLPLVGTKTTCLIERPPGYKYVKGRCTKMGKIKTLEKVNRPACTAQCEAEGDTCTAFFWNPKTQLCETLQGGCTDKLDVTQPEGYYTKESLTCSNSNGFTTVSMYVKDFFAMYIGLPASKTRDELCGDESYVAIQKEFSSTTSTLKTSCGTVEMFSLEIATAVAIGYRNMTCMNGVGWPQIGEPSTCEVKKCKELVYKYLDIDVIPALVNGNGALFTAAMKHNFVRRQCLDMMKTCSKMTQFAGVEGLSLIFTIFKSVYPQIEQFPGPKDDCQDTFFTDEVVKFNNFKASSTKGVQIVAADLCTMFSNLKASMYLVDGCQPSVKLSSQMMIEAFTQIMTGVCEKSTVECLKSTYMQCFIKRTEDLTLAFASGKGMESKICFNNTKENFNNDLQGCLSNGQGCTTTSVSSVSLLYPSLVEEFFSLCDKNENSKLNTYFAMSPQFEIEESKECLNAQAIVCLKSLNKIMIEGLTAGDDAASQICSAYESTKVCLTTNYKKCSPITRLNLLETLMKKRYEMIAAVKVCSFTETAACTTAYQNITEEFTIATKAVSAETYDCTKLSVLKASVATFISKSTCYELKTLYVQASLDTIEYFLRDRCSACAKTDALKNYIDYQNAFLDAVLNMWNYTTSSICTGQMSLTVFQSTLGDITKNCNVGGARLTAISQSTALYQGAFCKKKDFTWLVSVTETCKVDVVEACFKSYKEVYLVKLAAGDEQSVKQVCMLYQSLSACVVAAIKTCNGQTQARFLAGIAYLRSMLIVTCELKPVEKECDLVKANQCLTEFRANFETYRDLVVGGKTPKAEAVCGSAKLTNTCIKTSTLKCSDKENGMVMYFEKTFELYNLAIKKECDGLTPQQCDLSDSFKCLVTYAENVTETLMMVDRRTAFLCNTKVTEKVAECAATTTLDCGERSTSLIATVKGLERSTEQICQQLVCRQDEAKANILFLLDASGSVNNKDKTNFGKCKSFVKKVVEKLEIGENMIRVAGSTYASSVVRVFGFNRYYEKERVVEAVEKIVYTEGGTYTHVALANAVTDINNIKKERGDKVPSIVIIMTDGKSKSEKKTLEAAEELKRIATVYSIGIGNNLRAREVQAMASNSNNLYTAESFDKLDDIISSISQSITCEGFGQTPGDLKDPATCNLTEATACLATFEKELFIGFTKEGNDVLKVTCLSYKKTMACLKVALLECSGSTQLRLVEAFYLLIQSSMEVCKTFLPAPKDTCKVTEAMECFNELKKTISKVNGAYEKACVEINEKQNCVYDRIAGCTDFETYLWVSKIHAEVYFVKKSKKCEGKILPPQVTGKECDDSKATKCMFEFEELAVQAAFTNSFGTLCLKLVEFKECILGSSEECTSEQTASRINRFNIKYALVSPDCVATTESDECKFKEIREKMEAFAKNMLGSLMLNMTTNKNAICNDLHGILQYTVDNMMKCSLVMKSQIDDMARMLINQLKITCPNIVYQPVVRPTCDIVDVQQTLRKFNATVFANMAAGTFEFCAVQASTKTVIDAGLKNCPAEDVTAVTNAWATLVTKIGTSCNQRFDIDFGSTTRITVYEGETRILKYKFIGCTSALCQGEGNCQVKIFYTLTNLRGDAKCGNKERFLVQGAFSGTSCGFDLTDQNCGNEFDLVLRSRVFFVNQKTQIREVVFYAQVTINGVVAYKKLETKIQVTFTHMRGKPCRIWGDPHIETPDAKNPNKINKFNIFPEGLFVILKYKTVIGRNIEGIFQNCWKGRKVSCMCALYIQCGGGVVKFGECRRNTPPKKDPKCTKNQRKGFSVPKCDKKKPAYSPFMEVETMYNGNIDQCTIIKRSAYAYDVYQPHGRKISVSMRLPSNLRVVEIFIYPLANDNTETEGVCRATSTTWKQFEMSSKWNSFLAAENWAAYVSPVTSPTCLCTVTGEVEKNTLQINEECDGFQISKECNFSKQKTTYVTKALWDTARLIGITSTARKKRAVATSPFAIDPNATPQAVSWDGSRNFTEKKATDACNKAYDDYKAGALRTCLAFTKQDITNDFDQCVMDIKMSDTDRFCEPSAAELWKSCNNIRSADTAYMNSPAGQAVAAQLATLSCPSGCSGSSKGKCVAGVCDCVVPWGGEACDVNRNDPPNIIAVGTNGGVCDPGLANCSMVMIEAANVYDNPFLTCHFMEQKYKETGKTDVGATGTRRGELVTGSVRCILPKAVPYLIAISNDGKTTSSAYDYLVYSPKCETCDITAGTCKPVTTPVCRVNSVCYQDGEKLKENNCFYCNVKESTTKLSISTSDRQCNAVPIKKEGLDLTDIIIISVVVAGIVIGLLALLIYKFICKPKMDANKKAKELEKEQADNLHRSQEPQPSPEARYAEPPQGTPGSLE